MTALPQNDARPSLVGDALRRRWPIVLLTAALVVGAVAAYAFSVASTYTSTAQVLLRPTPGNALSPDSAKNAQQITVAMETEAGLVNSPGVAAYVSQLMRKDYPAASPDVDAVISTNTQIVQVSFTGDTAQEAQQVAEAYAKGFLQYRLSETQKTLDRELRQLKTQEKVAQDNLKEATADASVDRPTAQAVARVQLYSSRLASTQDLIGETNATDTNPGAIIIPASTPSKPNGISPVLLLLAGALLGLGFGVALAVWRERTDDRIRATVDPSSMGLPILGSVPAGGEDHDEDRTEAFRQIRAGVLVATDEPLVLAVAPVTDDVHVRTSCFATVELARSLSDAGRRVVVVDATAPAAGLDRVLGADHPGGLMELLAAPVDADPYAAASPASAADRAAGAAASSAADLARDVTTSLRDAQGFVVLPSGTTTREPADLVASDRMRLVVEHLRAEFDIVLLAAPSATTSQGNEVCMAADATVLVVTERRTRATEVGEALERAARLGIRYIGLVALPRRLGAVGAHEGSRGAGKDASVGGSRGAAGRSSARPSAATAADDGSADGAGALAGARGVGRRDA